MNLNIITENIKKYAFEIGFDSVGIVKADFLSEEKEHFTDWLKNKYNAGMDYMSQNIEKRLNPALLLEDAKSVVVVLKNYYPENQQISDTYKISKYAYGNDYHDIIKNDLKILLENIKSFKPDVNARVFVDSAPVLERALAKKTGLGWIGKNSMLITKKGSFFFIGIIILDIELTYENNEQKSLCGNCSKCIDSCPTNAIVKPFVVDSNKCISYLTIENKSEIDKSFKNKFQNYIFGCDICQDVCPWNSKQKPTNDKNFQISDLLKKFTKTDWENISKENFDVLFKKSPIKRTKFEGLKRNISLQ